MGGWRCSYGNCSAAADGKTHLFHYPVFDKVRCLKWLTNAGKLEFLNLKVSQLKNRVVCQHHFKDECFMNYKKDKLTFAAVPTENGSCNDLVVKNDQKFCLPITLEEIENSEIRSLTPREKKANYPVIYADFLTDPVIHSADNIPETANDIKQKNTKKDNDLIDFKLWSHKTNVSKTAQESSEIAKDNNLIDFKMWSHKTNFSKTAQEHSEIITSQSVSQQLSNFENADKGISFQIDINPTQDVLNFLKATPNVVQNSNKPLSEDMLSSSKINLSNNTDALCNNISITANSENKITGKSKNKINIISEKTLTVPFPLVGKFEPVSPTGILNPRKRKFKTELINKENSYSATVKEEHQVPEVQISLVPVEHKSPTKPNLLEPKNNSTIVSPPNIKQNESMVNSKSPNTKNKVPPERIAAIEEKRMFNKKLRDMIEFCLDDKEENSKTLINMKPTKKLQTVQKETKNLPHIKSDPLYKQSEKCTTNSISENVQKEVEDKESSLNEKEVIRNSETNTYVPDYKLTALEAKLSRMESLLLKKVGENTQRIDLLKQTLTKSKNVQKRSIQTTTTRGTEMHKKQLFHEISKYLSPNLNSLIYEELFLKDIGPTTTYSNVSKKKVGLSPIKRQRQ